MNERAFTLTELLIGIAIIGLLIGFLTPVMSKALGAAQRAQCINGLQQIGMAFYLYLDEHDETFPAGGGSNADGSVIMDWESALLPYVESNDVLICPVKSVGKFFFFGEWFEVKVDGHYGYNGYIGGGSPKRLPRITSVTRKILCADGISYATFGGFEPASTFAFDYRHSNGASFLFVGNNVKWFPKGQEAFVW